MLSIHNNGPLTMFLTVLAWLYALAALLGRITWLRGFADVLASRLWPRRPAGYRRAGPPPKTHPYSRRKPGG